MKISPDFRIPQRPMTPEQHVAADDLVKQVAVLWPYLNLIERWDWAKMVTAVNGIYPEGNWQNVGMPLILAEVERRENER